jgi:divalent metal cation (Fe/Co/Zn/Cd) transporter
MASLPLPFWWLDPVGAIIISLYIIYSWYHTGREQIEQLTGKSAPQDFIEELMELAENFDERIMVVDTIRAYHFGKFYSFACVY